MAPGRRTRILIVDDSAVMRCLLRSVTSSDPAFEVAGTAADGESALSILESLRPDLVLLDVEMPVMDGLVTLKKLRARGYRMPVVMCSSLTQRGARVTIEALAGGASDYVAKPAGQASREAALQTLSQDLIPKIHALTSQSQVQPQSASSSDQPGAPSFPHTGVPTDSRGRDRSSSVEWCSAERVGVRATHPVQPVPSLPTVLAIGISTGGPAALDVLLPALPESFPLPVLIVQHMPELFTQLLAERLNQRCRLSVREAAEGSVVRPGTVHIARGNWHLEVLAAARAGLPATLHLTQGPLENHCRPSVDVLFRSAAAVYGSGVLAVVLTGMGSDGLAGCRIVHTQGGAVLAQDQATSAVWGMPGAVARAGLAHRVLPLNAIAPEILRLASRTCSEARGLRESVV